MKLDSGTSLAVPDRCNRAGAVDFNEDVSYTEFLAKVLQAMCRAAANGQPPLLSIDYNGFKERVITDLVGHFGLSVNALETETMLSKSRLNAKSPDGGEVFKPDASRKQRQATPLVNSLSEELVVPVFNDLK